MLVFPRINLAIKFTLEYYEIGRIADHISRFSGAHHYGYLDTYYENTLRTHRLMEDEIIQTILTANENAQMVMFEDLKLWLNDWRITGINIQYLSKLVDDYNDKAYVKYEQKIKEDELKFRLTVDFNRPHGEKYEVENTLIPAAFMAGGYTVGRYPKKRTITNSWFYCNTETPELIDKSYLPQYIDFLKGIIENFKSAIQKHIERYEAGKIKPGTIAIGHLQAIKPATLQPLPETLYKQTKIKVNLTASRLLFLFKMLYELKIIETTTYKELHQFIADSFQVKSKKENEQLSVGKLGRLWSNFDVEDAKFWTGKFIELHNRAKKDNPNNIK
ncbi:hypothetical protein [Flavisolibacter nicotianae]|uniref:hypothetical protein n=1 Tax=Flavisolibacter nicotianae TaxID=2364882 RepID=UPI000EB40BC2|nr:hypothetical protein [Flavisolibacter nicotianae]